MARDWRRTVERLDALAGDARAPQGERDAARARAEQVRAAHPELGRSAAQPIFDAFNRPNPFAAPPESATGRAYERDELLRRRREREREAYQARARESAIRSRVQAEQMAQFLRDQVDGGRTNPTASATSPARRFVTGTSSRLYTIGPDGVLRESGASGSVGNINIDWSFDGATLRNQ